MIKLSFLLPVFTLFQEPYFLEHKTAEINTSLLKTVDSSVQNIHTNELLGLYVFYHCKELTPYTAGLLFSYKS